MISSLYLQIFLILLIIKYLHFTFFLPSNRLVYITLLRNPIDRYISELVTINLIGQEFSSGHYCNGHYANTLEIPHCFEESSYFLPNSIKNNVKRTLDLESFVNCPQNPANNRQAFMLSDRRLINCFNNSNLPEDARDNIIFKSAKENLLKMRFFGLTEYMFLNQYLFELTFPNLKFQNRLCNLRSKSEFNSDSQTTKLLKDLILKNSSLLPKIYKNNIIDQKLYSVSKELFYFRIISKIQKEFNYFNIYRMRNMHIDDSLKFLEYMLAFIDPQKN